MSSDAEPAAEAAAPAPARRLTPKLMIVGGGAALALLLVLGGATWLLWPAAEKAPVAKTKVNKAVALQAASAPAESAPVVVDATPVTTPAMDATDATDAVAAVAAAASAGDQGSSAAEPTPQNEPEPTLQASAAAPPPHMPAQAEDPMDRLQRRLGQVLGDKAAVEAARSGEWRLVTRASNIEPAAHAAVTPARTSTPAQRGPAHAEHSLHWAYDGRGGPQAWGKLRPEFATCASGRRQSPIDIRDGLALELEPVQFDYHPSRFGVIDTGHTVQVNVAPGNSIDIGGRRYELLQFHFHRPSEERIDGRRFDMVAHLVHKDAEGRLAVVAVLLERGAAQPLVQTVWNHLPLEKGEEAPARLTLDLNELLPTQRGYYTYMGSLTTPPCSEGVLWVVLQQPMQVSGTQIDIFSRLYPMNARPIQQASGRIIKQSQ